MPLFRPHDDETLASVEPLHHISDVLEASGAALRVVTITDAVH